MSKSTIPIRRQRKWVFLNNLYTKLPGGCSRLRIFQAIEAGMIDEASVDRLELLYDTIALLIAEFGIDPESILKKMEKVNCARHSRMDDDAKRLLFEEVQRELTPLYVRLLSLGFSKQEIVG